MQSNEKPRGPAKYMPIVSWLPKYNRAWLRTDFIAGLIILALLVPEGMAYATLAGVPPQAAFYAAPAGLMLYAIFGSSLRSDRFAKPSQGLRCKEVIEPEQYICFDTLFPIF